MRHAISAGALLLSAAASAHEVAPPVTPQAEVQPEPAAFKPPVIKKRVEPDYPESAMKDGITGTVVLQIGIDESGRVVEARVERGVRDDVDAAALAAVKQLEFEPARAGKEPVRVRLVYEQTFALHAAAPPPVTPKEPVRAAPETRLRGPYEATVRAERPLTAASATTVRDRDFLLRPHPRPADVLRVAPGLMVVQHAGGGKANQYFLRGFDADHGSDVALSFDGVPANAVSHGHGQGYADLNWVIPELVERIEVRKGLYFAVDGDFATAGAIDLQSRRAFDRSSLTLGGGAFATLRALAIASPKMDGLSPLFVAEAYATDGPFRSPERLQRYSLFAKVTHDLSASASVSVAATACAAGWNASGQVPLREVQAGRLDRFGTVDPSDGGGSERHSVYLALRAEPAADSSFEALAYVVSQRLALFSNFTFFSDDPVNGDQIEQDDRRGTTGLRARYARADAWGELRLRTSMGISARADDVENALYHAAARERLDARVHARVREAGAGAWVQGDASWRFLRLVAAVRGDLFSFEVDDLLEDRATAGTRTSGVRAAALLSPKASAVVTPLEGFDLFLNFGTGYHSNDARSVVRGTDPVTPLTRATGYEMGARLRLFERVDLAAALFGLDLASEVVWVGDAGTTEARGPTRRLGAEAEARVQILDWIFADLDLAFASAVFTGNPGNANAVALAPTFTASGGLSARHPSGVYGRLGFRAAADRPATEDRAITAQGFFLLDAALGYRHPWFEVSAWAENLLNSDWREAQFANVSRLPREQAPAGCPAPARAVGADGAFLGCEDLHFTPGAPLNVQGAVTLFF